MMIYGSCRLRSLVRATAVVSLLYTLSRHCSQLCQLLLEDSRHFEVFHLAYYLHTGDLGEARIVFSGVCQCHCMSLCVCLHKTETELHLSEINVTYFGDVSLTFDLHSYFRTFPVF